MRSDDRPMCPDCGERFARNASHHRAKYGGCCKTFSGDKAYDHHRTGHGTCIPVEACEPWRLNAKGEWTDSAPMTAEEKARSRQ